MAGKLKVGPTPSERRALGLRGPGYSPQCEGAVHMFGGLSFKQSERFTPRLHEVQTGTQVTCRDLPLAGGSRRLF